MVLTHTGRLMYTESPIKGHLVLKVGSQNQTSSEARGGGGALAGTCGGGGRMPDGLRNLAV